MSSIRSFTWAKIGLWILAGVSTLALIVANLGNTEAATDEWQYTTRILNQSLPIVIGGALIFLFLYPRCKSFCARLSLLFLWAGLGCVLIPELSNNYHNSSWQMQYFFSLVWSLAFLFLGIASFLLAEGRVFKIWGFCAIGSFLIGLSSAEFFLLGTSQAGDGIDESPNQSKYQADKKILLYSPWKSGVCGSALEAAGQPYAFIHHSRKFDETLFDVKYDINDRGHRQMPIADRGAPNDLLIFGCSYSFGHGLENDETWAWQLASRLGRTWQVENYAQNGYGASQMLCMLEHDLVAPLNGKRRFALFLSIAHHVRRNEFFPDSPHYIIRDGSFLSLEGEPRYAWLTRLPRTMNGSQLAGAISQIGTKIILENHPEFLQTYLSIIIKSGQLLKEKYNTQLVVLLWPDIEFLKPELEKADIPVLFARNALTDWEKDGGASYMIHPLYESHPNARASIALGEWLAAWFEKRAQL